MRQVVESCKIEKVQLMNRFCFLVGLFIFHIWMAVMRGLSLSFQHAPPFLYPPFSSINQEKFQSQWDGPISQAENSFTSKHFMKKLLLINHENSHHDGKSLTNLSK